jgi:hypothetical protein
MIFLSAVIASAGEAGARQSIRISGWIATRFALAMTQKARKVKELASTGMKV